jgi:broad specificity phosphatase PhoE
VTCPVASCNAKVEWGPANKQYMEKCLNHLYAVDHLNNRYFAMRHGHSLANQQGIVVSHPENGCAGYGLSELGVEQVQSSLQQQHRLDAGTIIVSSDFRRARESAVIAQQRLGCVSPIATDIRLRERYFAELELGPDSAYQSVWHRDQQDPDSDCRGVETANQVMARVSALIIDLETRYMDTNLLLVSHGDALQILQTAFARRDASQHRQLHHLQTAEIRCLQLAEKSPD